MGSRATHRCRLEPEDVQRQSCGSRRAGACTTIAANSSPISRPALLGRDYRRSVRCEPISALGEFVRLAALTGIPICSDFAIPWGPTLGPPPTRQSTQICSLPNAAAISPGCLFSPSAITTAPTSFPYTMNQTLDIQWQPRNDLGDSRSATSAISAGMRSFPSVQPSANCVAHTSHPAGHAV